MFERERQGQDSRRKNERRKKREKGKERGDVDKLEREGQ
jgi:hypothetical protein